MALFTERLLDFRSCWIVFIHVVRGCPGICFDWHLCNVTDQGEMPCLRVQLLNDISHRNAFIEPNVVCLFNRYHESSVSRGVYLACIEMMVM